MNINKILYPILLLLVVLSSCDYESPLDKEQYKKTLYLIGASSNLVTKELAYSSEVQEGFITVGVSGSLLIDGNVDVTLESHNSVIDWYNKKFKFLATDIKYQGLAASAFRGWFQWYCRYYYGRRLPEADEIQIKRWRSFRRHLAQVEKNCMPLDIACRTRQRQALLQWAYNPVI